MSAKSRFSLLNQHAWRVWRDAESQQWIGVCDALRITAIGNTWGELHQYADEIVDALFTDLLQTADLKTITGHLVRNK